MIRSLLSAALAVTATAAGAQEAPACRNPSPAATFADAAAAPGRYIIVLGAIDVPPGALAERSDATDPMPGSVRVAATFRGRQMEADGTFSSPVAAPVMVEQVCIEGFCGAFAQDRRVLAFLRETDGDGFVLDADPCSTWYFPYPTDAMIETVSACATGGECLVPGE